MYLSLRFKLLLADFSQSLLKFELILKQGDSNHYVTLWRNQSFLMLWQQSNYWRYQPLKEYWSAVCWRPVRVFSPLGSITNKAIFPLQHEDYKANIELTYTDLSYFRQVEVTFWWSPTHFQSVSVLNICSARLRS